MALKRDDTIVVTGGAGFIGANVVAALNARGHERIVVVDRLGTDDKWRNLLGLAIEDVVDKEVYIERVLAGAEAAPAALIHLGACSATTERDADFLLRNNTDYTRALTEWSLEAGFRLIVASSAATYGDGALGFSDEDAVTPTLRPLNMYGMSKQLFDLWALRRGHYRTIVGLKFFNVFGPRESHKGDMRSVVHKAYHQVRETGAIGLFKSGRADYKDGEQRRDFIGVEDAVAVVLHFLEHPQVGGLFNCGTGNARTWLDLAHAVFAAMGRPPRITWLELPAHLADRYQYFTQATTEKLRGAGFTRAFTPLEDAVKSYIEWLRREEP